MTDRQLDLLIEHKIMGDPTAYLSECCNGPNYYDPPNYCNDMSAAWLIVEKMIGNGSNPGIQGGLDNETGKPYYQARIDDYLAYGDTAPKAIVLAALKVIGVKVE